MDAFDRRRRDAASGKNGKRKSRKERERDNQRERAQIERSWDAPILPTAPVEEAVSVNKLDIVNGTTGTSNAHDIFESAARASVLAAASFHASAGVSQSMDKNEFVREVLLLIHVRNLLLVYSTSLTSM